MNTSQPASRELAFRGEEYDDRLFLACSLEFEVLQSESGLPWIEAFEAAVFQVSAPFVREELGKTIGKIDDLATCIGWAWRMFAFGGYHSGLAPEGLAFELARAASANASEKLAVLVGRSENVQLLLAKEIVEVWRPLFKTMRTRRDYLRQTLKGYQQELETFRDTAGDGRVLPHGRIPSFGETLSYFFRPDMVHQHGTSIETLLGEVAKESMNIRLARAFMALPFKVEALPARDPITLSRLAVDLSENWLRTQVLLAATKAGLWQESVPFNVEKLILNIPTSLTQEGLIALFWRRMDERLASRGQAPLGDEAKALIAPQLATRAQGVLVDAKILRDGRPFGDESRTAYVLGARPPQGRAPTRPEGANALSVEEFIQTYIDTEHDEADGEDDDLLGLISDSVRAYGADDLVKIVNAWHGQLNPVTGEEELACAVLGKAAAWPALDATMRPLFERYLNRAEQPWLNMDSLRLEDVMDAWADQLYRSGDYLDPLRCVIEGCRPPQAAGWALDDRNKARAKYYEELYELCGGLVSKAYYDYEVANGQSKPKLKKGMAALESFLHERLLVHVGITFCAFFQSEDPSGDWTGRLSSAERTRGIWPIRGDTQHAANEADRERFYAELKRLSALAVQPPKASKPRRPRKSK